MIRFLSLAALALATACTPAADVVEEEPRGLPVLGADSHSLVDLDVEIVAEQNDSLSFPRDLAFNPLVPGELWVVNTGTNSTTILQNAGTEDQVVIFRGDTYGSQHFLASPSSLDFGDNGMFATAQEEDEPTQGTATPADFMGPTLWTSDLDIHDGGHAGHMDMLHNSPNGMGIAWEEENTYWVFDGWNSSLTRYAFNDHHGPGGSDHSDAVIERYVEGEVARAEGVPSHLHYDHETDLLYVADTGNNRIAVLDTLTGEQGRSVGPYYDVPPSQQYRVDDAVLTTLVDGTAVDGMEQPSGLERHGELLFVTDAQTGRVFAFDLDGELVDWLDMEVAAGALAGLAFDEDGRMLLVDVNDDLVVRVSTR